MCQKLRKHILIYGVLYGLLYGLLFVFFLGWYNTPSLVVRILLVWSYFFLMNLAWRHAVCYECVVYGGHMTVTDKMDSGKHD